MRVGLPLFSTWTRPEVVAAIKDLERGIALGAAAIQYPNGGGTTLVSRAEAMQTLRGLYARLSDIDGTGATPNAGVRFIRGYARRGL